MPNRPAGKKVETPGKKGDKTDRVRRNVKGFLSVLAFADPVDNQIVTY
jgi:hypothetical protein